MTTAFLFIAAAIAVITGLVMFVRSRMEVTYQVPLTELPRVLTALLASSDFPAFAVLMFNPSGQPGPDDTVNIQCAVDSHRVGLDWVLIGPRNIADEARFAEFARAAGYDSQQRERNGVRYLRVEDGDLAVLCRDVITKLYGRDENETVEMLVEGFEWTPLIPPAR